VGVAVGGCEYRWYAVLREQFDGSVDTVPFSSEADIHYGEIGLCARPYTNCFFRRDRDTHDLEAGISEVVFKVGGNKKSSSTINPG
jgi:hypothetical protein